MRGKEKVKGKWKKKREGGKRDRREEGKKWDGEANGGRTVIEEL